MTQSNPMQKYKRWLDAPEINSEIKAELEGIKHGMTAITDRFWQDLQFGTGGLRGIIGAGTNRMNIYTISKATRGFGEYLLEKYIKPCVAIAYDTRNKSTEFAKQAASVLCDMGISVYLFEGVRPTPMLSFAVRYYQCSGGIVITASHNPKEYNGYKVYGPDGCQVTDEAAGLILQKINAWDVFHSAKGMQINQAIKSKALTIIGKEVDEAYYQQVSTLTMRRKLIKEKAGDLKILYTPLHGAGNIPVRHMLSMLGFVNIEVVKEQELPDGDFPTVPYPNPEVPQVFDLAKKMAQKSDPDLIFATDPDSDRIGVLAKNQDANNQEYSVLTGNQVGALLCDYIIKTKLELKLMPENPAIIKTIVTSDLAQAICDKHKVKLFNVLTGFKYIGEMMGQWEKTNEYSFLLGYEESYGYLSGNFVRDKDGVIAAVLIAEMTLYYKQEGMNLLQALDQIYTKYGHTCEKQIAIEMPGQEGHEQINHILTHLRQNYKAMFKGKELRYVQDYLNSTQKDTVTGKESKISLPASNVLKFIFKDGSWLALRPSGTEPKIKVYIYAKGEDHKEARDREDEIEALARKLLA